MFSKEFGAGLNFDEFPAQKSQWFMAFIQMDRRVDKYLHDKEAAKSKGA